MIGRVLRTALMPLHALRILSSEKSFAAPIIGDPAYNRRGPHVWRALAATRMAEWRRRRLARLVAPEDRRAFERGGYVAKPDFLDRAVFRRLVAEIAELKMQAREMREGDAITRRVAVTPEILRRAPALKALLDHPDWRGLTRYVSSFDIGPMVYVQTVLAKTDASFAEDPKTSLHMDTFHPTLKAWFFLHRVADDEGPFT